MLTSEEFYKEIKKLKSKNRIPNQKDSFAVERADRVAAVILAVLSDMTICNRFLDELNEKIATKTQEHDFTKFIPPDYEELHSIKLPQPEENELPYALELVTAFEEILLSNEQAHGINLGITPDQVPEFIMQIPESIADTLVLNDYSWMDYNGDPTGFIHSPDAHRIQGYILRRALQEHCVDLKLLDGYVDLNSPGTILKYLLPTVTKYTFGIPIDALKMQKRSHWHITMENDPYKPYNSLSCLPKESKKQPVTHLAGPTKVLEYSLSQPFFETRPHLAQALYSRCFKELRNIAAIRDESVRDTFRQFVYGHKQERFDNLELNKAIEKAIEQKVEKAKGKQMKGEYPSYLLHQPKMKEPNLEHAKKTFEKAKTAVSTKEYDKATKKYCKAASEFERVNDLANAATSIYSAGLVKKKQSLHEQAGFFYDIAYHLRLSLFGANNPKTREAKEALESVKGLH